MRPLARHALTIARGQRRAAFPTQFHLVRCRLQSTNRGRPTQTSEMIHPTGTGQRGDGEEQPKEHDSQIFNPPGSVNFPGAGGGFFNITGSPGLDAALTTLVGLAMVFFGGVGYVAWYKKNVLDKIELAFAPGYDPALELVKHSRKHDEAREEDVDDDWTQHMRRKEQAQIDRIIKGGEAGHYYFILGSKGSGKGTMIFDAMQSIQADGVAFLEAHPDLEVFRLRLGKALNFEFNEDSQTGLFQRRDPREAGPSLDIERALNKLEKVALRLARKRERPLVLIFNNVHLFNNDDEGRAMLLQLQQRAETWAESGILTTVFSSDDFWPCFTLRKAANRMHVLSVYDLDEPEAQVAMRRIRKNSQFAKDKLNDAQVVSLTAVTGGRLAFISKVARARDPESMAAHLVRYEKAWLLSQIGLIPDCDDDVMDEQKWASCSWLLMQEFVKIRQEQEKERHDAALHAFDTLVESLPMPSIPYWRCRQIMTRPDFLEELDRRNIVSIDINHDVRPDSMLVLQAAREAVEEEGFEVLLNNVRDRVDEIESLHRTRELTFKDIPAGGRVRLLVDKDAARLLED